MAKFVDKPTELFYSRNWALLIRAAGGDYTLYSPSIPIFLKNIIYYIYTASYFSSTGRHLYYNYIHFISRDYYFVSPFYYRILFYIERFLPQGLLTEKKKNFLRNALSRYIIINSFI